jgi:methionine synthase II (cobalamin-independent)
MSNTEFNCLPTIIGSMPHTDAKKCCALIVKYLKDLPAWPQLPRKSFLENMYVQYSEGFPGVVIENNRIYVDTSKDYSKALEDLYVAFLNDDYSKYNIGREYGAGLYAFLEEKLTPKAVKGHVTGPISWGMTVTDEKKQAILFHEILGDAVPKLLKLKAAWQEKEIKKLNKNTITFVDEPYMASAGSSLAAGVLSSPEKIATMINEVFEGISGLKGIHCCGNTDWSVLLKTKLDILNFDAYDYGASLALYPDEIKKFIGRGGVIAWGIVPNHTEPVTKETIASLKDRLEETIAPFTRNGLSYKDVLKQSILTPCCALTSLGEEGAEKALELLVGLSTEMRKKI